MNDSGQNGFTVVELMVGLVSAAILALVFSAMLILGYKGWTRLQAESAMQADADVAMRTMDRISRSATNATVSANTLTFVLTNGVSQFSKSVSNLSWGSSVLISNRVSVFSNALSADNKTIAVTLKLVEGTAALDMQYSIFLRNKP